MHLHSPLTARNGSVYEYGDKPSKYLSHLTKIKRDPQVIPSILDGNGTSEYSKYWHYVSRKFYLFSSERIRQALAKVEVLGTMLGGFCILSIFVRHRKLIAWSFHWMQRRHSTVSNGHICLMSYIDLIWETIFLDGSDFYVKIPWPQSSPLAIVRITSHFIAQHVRASPSAPPFLPLQ